MVPLATRFVPPPVKRIRLEEAPRAVAGAVVDAVGGLICSVDARHEGRSGRDFDGLRDGRRDVSRGCPGTSGQALHQNGGRMVERISIELTNRCSKACWFC